MTETQQSQFTLGSDASARARSDASHHANLDASARGHPYASARAHLDAYAHTQAVNRDPLNSLQGVEDRASCTFGSAVDVAPTPALGSNAARGYRLLQPQGHLGGPGGYTVHRPAPSYYGQDVTTECDGSDLRPPHSDAQSAHAASYYTPASAHMYPSPFSYNPSEHLGGYRGPPLPHGPPRRPLAFASATHPRHAPAPTARPSATPPPHQAPAVNPPFSAATPPLVLAQPSFTTPASTQPPPSNASLFTPTNSSPASVIDEFANLIAGYSPATLESFTSCDGELNSDSDGGGPTLLPQAQPSTTQAAIAPAPVLPAPVLPAPVLAAHAPGGANTVPFSLSQDVPNHASFFTGGRCAQAPDKISKDDLSKSIWDDEEDAGGSHSPKDPATPLRKTFLTRQLFGSTTPKPRRGRLPSPSRSRSLDPPETPKVARSKKRALSELPGIVERDEDGCQTPTPSPHKKAEALALRFKRRKANVVVSDEDEDENGEERRELNKKGNADDADDTDADDGEEEEEEEASSHEEGWAIKVGRPNKQEKARARQGVLDIKERIDALARELARPVSYVTQKVNKLLGPGRALSGLCFWSLYVGYWWRYDRMRLGLSRGSPTKKNFKNFKETFPKDWEEMLQADHSLNSSKVQDNVGTRTKGFKKFSDDVVGLIEEAEKLGFEAVFAACGSVVHEDGHLGKFHQTRRMDGFVQQGLRKGMTSDSFLGQMKTHSFHMHSKEYAANSSAEADDSGDEACSVTETQLTALSGDKTVSAAKKLNDDKLIRHAVLLRSLTPAQMDTINGDTGRKYVGMYTELRCRIVGASLGRTTFPWGKNLRKGFGKIGVAIRGWPQGVPMLGEGDPHNGLRFYGVNGVRGIIKALAGDEVQFIKVDAAALGSNKLPMVEEAPPPKGQKQKRGRRMFVNGDIDSLGPPRVKTSTSNPEEATAQSQEKPLLTQPSTSSSKRPVSKPSHAGTKKKHPEIANEQVLEPVPSARKTRSKSKAASSSKSKSNVDDTDDDMPLMSRSKANKVERIPLPGNRKVPYIDNSEDGQFEPPTEEEIDSPRGHKRRRRHSSLPGETDLFISSDNSRQGEAGSDGNNNVNPPPTAAKSKTTKLSAPFANCNPSGPASANTTTRSAASKTAPTKAAPPKSASSKSASSSSVPKTAAPAEAAFAPKAMSTSESAPQHPAGTSPAEPMPHPAKALGPRPRKIHPVKASTDLDSRFTIQRKRKSDSTPAETLSDAHEGQLSHTREKRARIEAANAQINPSSTSSSEHSASHQQKLLGQLATAPPPPPPPHYYQRMHEAQAPRPRSTHLPQSLHVDYSQAASYPDLRAHSSFAPPRHPHFPQQAPHRQPDLQQQAPRRQPSYYAPQYPAPTDYYGDYNYNYGRDYTYEYDFVYSQAYGDEQHPPHPPASND